MVALGSVVRLGPGFRGVHLLPRRIRPYRARRRAAKLAIAYGTDLT
jgi:hypothetical protein